PAARRSRAAKPDAASRSGAGGRGRVSRAGRSERRPAPPAIQIVIRVFSTPQSAARALANRLARMLRADPSLVLGLPTGRTPIPLYQHLVELHRGGRADFSRATTFNLDEFIGIDAADPRSYRAFMQRHLFDHINISPRRINFLNGTASDLDRECARYER